jgi:hypothetical protein
MNAASKTLTALALAVSVSLGAQAATHYRDEVKHEPPVGF